MAHEHMERGGFSCSFAGNCSPKTVPVSGQPLGAPRDVKPVPTDETQAGSPRQQSLRGRFTVSQVHGTRADRQMTEMAFFLLGLFLMSRTPPRALVTGSSEKAKFVKHSSFVEGCRLSQLSALQMSHACSLPGASCRVQGHPRRLLTKAPLSRCLRPSTGLHLAPR